VEDAALRFGDDLVGDDHHVAIVQR
jgi:hypothetical protein